MAELKENKQRNGKLSLYPLKFEETVKDLLKVKPEIKVKDITVKIITVKEGEK